MPPKRKVEEVGDLFVTKEALTVKLLPSRKSGTRSIRWFAGGRVTDVGCAAKDIAVLVGRLRGDSRVVRGLTVMTDRGGGHDLKKAGLTKAVEKAGFGLL